MWVAENAQLTATVLPENAGNKNVSWQSSNTAVAEVSSTGEITAKAAGTAVIIASTEDGGFTASCTVEVFQQQIEIDDDPETGADGTGKIVLSLTIPADVLFSGQFRLVLPDGVELNLDITHLAGDLASTFQLVIERQPDGSWLFTITPLATRSATEMVYKQIVEIAYKVSETLAPGTLEATIRDLSFDFENGATITESEILVQITVLPTGIPGWTEGSSVYWSGGRLYIDSPAAETIRVYSTTGMLLYSVEKPAGTADYPVDKSKSAILIVKGSSGWVKKVI